MIRAMLVALALAAASCGTLQPVAAQAAAKPTPRLMIFADTAGIASVAPHTFMTWVYAKAGPNTWPSSGVLVVFDCANQRVGRVAHVVFQMRPDSAGVSGNIVEDSTGWQPVSIRPLFDLVCRIGEAHFPAEQGAARKPSPTQPTPPPSGKPWSIA